MDFSIRWEDIERGEFRIVDSVLVAKLWATVKKNKKMNYEKLSRAMRWEKWLIENNNKITINIFPLHGQKAKNITFSEYNYFIF